MDAPWSGTYPYSDQIKFIAYKFDRPSWFCSSSPKMDKDKWRLVRDSRLNFTINSANAEQTKDINHYAALIDQAKLRIAWNQARDGDIARLARVCNEYKALVSNVNVAKSADGKSDTKIDPRDTVMSPDFARKTGEVNGAAKKCGFKIRESERIFSLLPGFYLDQKRNDLLDQAAASSLAFQKRYDNDPVGACDQARSRNFLVFE
jgi:hypothetical protein